MTGASPKIRPKANKELKRYNDIQAKQKYLDNE